MEIKAQLLKPYTDKQRIDFIVQQNHRNSYEIKETEKALEAWGYTEAEKQQLERERLDMLFLTSADVERGIYRAKGMDFDDIMAFVMANPPAGLDVKALKIELKANNFYRGNPYVNAVGELLRFTSEQLDKFFADGNYEHLLPVEEETEDGVLGEPIEEAKMSQPVNDEVADEDTTAE